MTRHRQNYELLPSGVPANKRDPAWRLVGLTVMVLLLVAATSLAAWTLISQPSGTPAASPSTSTAQTTLPPAPNPTQVSETRNPPRTIAASGLSTIPETILLPHETDDAWAGSNLNLDTCRDTEPERGVMEQATDIRTISMQTDNAERSETLVIAPDDATADAMYNRLSQAMSNCTQPTNSIVPAPVTGQTTVLQLLDDGQHLDTGWDRAGIFAVGHPAVESDEPNVSSYLLLARSGRALAIASAAGSDFPLPRDGEPHAGTAASLQSFADALAPQVCIFKTEGCKQVPPPAPSFPEGAVQLPDGTVMLPDGEIVQADGHPIGYRPTPTPAPQ